MALPGIFPSISVGPDYAPEEFIGAGFGFNNPTRELLKEAKSEYGDERQIALILSLGSGRPKELSLDAKVESDTTTDLLMKLIVSGEMVEKEISYQLYDIGAYMRLNVDRGVDEIRFHDWNLLGRVKSYTSSYLESELVTRLVNRSVIALKEREGIMSLYQLS
jgi:hypothetical protein